MGRRAQVVAKFSRRAAYNLSNAPRSSAIFVCNHVHAVMGGRGHSTPGGDTLKFMSGVRLYLWSENIKSGDDIIGWLINGTVEKLRFGAKGRKFRCVNLPGVGISRNLSALYDCEELGQVQFKNTVQVYDPFVDEWKSAGYKSKLFQDAADGKDESFEIFHTLIKRHKDETKLHPA